MNARPRQGRWLASATIGALIGVIVAAIAAFVLHSMAPDPSDLHELLHRAVPLDRQEAQFLDVKEREFQLRRNEIEMEVRAANGRLATAITTDPRWSPDVEQATREVERAAAAMQRATLVHVFEMRAGLKPEHRAAYDRVLVDALRHGSR